MSNTYLHGAYGNIGATQAQSALQSGAVPCYIGTAPVHLVRGYASKGLVNKPVKLSNLKQSMAAIGYARDWGKYTLCEPVKLHFDNPLGNVGPVYVINVLDPSVHRAAEATQQSLTFVNGRVEFASHDIILDTFAIEDKTEGIDYALDYNYTSGTVIVTALTDMGTVSAAYNTVTPAAVTSADIIGGKTAAGVYSGIGALELLYNSENQVATMLAAPGWSHEPSVRNALVTACQKMNGHWMAYCYTDIPVADEEGGAGTIAEAIAWKQSKGYTSQFETPCWPKSLDNEGNVCHGSALSVWRQQMVDYTHDGIPFETASNKAVPGVKQYFGTGSPNAGFDKETANALNENGIRTIVPYNGSLVLWGGHTGAYTYGATSDALQIFDTNVRMVGYVINSFQREWGNRIDEPMTVQLKDEILNREQDKLDALVARGALIGNPTISFFASENLTTDMMNGDFTFDHLVTPTPQLKSATATVSYTDAGFSVYTVED